MSSFIFKANLEINFLEQSLFFGNFYFLVTRAASKWLENHRYNKICRVKICRHTALDKQALARPTTARIRRHRSMHNLSHPPPSSSPRKQPHPVLDMAKIRSILKKTIDKPQNSFARRKSMSNVTFAATNQTYSPTMVSDNEDVMTPTPRQSKMANTNSGKSFRKKPRTLFSRVDLLIKQDNVYSDSSPNVTSINTSCGTAQVTQLTTPPSTLPALVQSLSTSQATLIQDVSLGSSTTSQRPLPALIPIGSIPQTTPRSEVSSTISTTPKRSLSTLIVLRRIGFNSSATPTTTSNQRPLPEMIPIHVVARQTSPSNVSLVTPQRSFAPISYSYQGTNRSNDTSNLLIQNPSSPQQGPSGLNTINFGRLSYDSDSDYN